eukprot:5684095-Pyramimonas_sp.AAC.1
MARRSRDDLAFLGHSLLRHNIFGYGLRLKRSAWLGLPPPFKLAARVQDDQRFSGPALLVGSAGPRP